MDPILQDSHWYFQVLVDGTKNWARDTRIVVKTDSSLRGRKAFMSRAVVLWVGTGLWPCLFIGYLYNYLPIPSPGIKLAHFLFDHMFY